MGGNVVLSHDVVLVYIIIVVRCRCHCRQSMAVMIVTDAHCRALMLMCLSAPDGT